MESSKVITLSIVSHGQGMLVEQLLSDLNRLYSKEFEVIITLNLPEDESFLVGHNFKILVIKNTRPKGFGANHNAAFKLSSSKLFAILNPDIRLYAFDLWTLLAPFQNENIMVVAPLVLSAYGEVEDSARRFPTASRLFRRSVFGIRTADYKVEEYAYPVDWVAGMFMVFRREAYLEVDGFDEKRFYMYLEDADICRRIAKKNWLVVVNPMSKVTHMARRASRRNLKHMRWHIVSAMRYLSGL